MFLIAIVVNFVITGDWPNLMRFGIPEDLPSFNIIEVMLISLVKDLNINGRQEPSYKIKT